MIRRSKKSWTYPSEDFVAVNDRPEHIELGDGYL
jgi:hypothetical protein